MNDTIDWNQIIIEYMIQEYNILDHDINDIDILLRSKHGMILKSSSLNYQSCCYKIATRFGYSQRIWWYHQSQVISRFVNKYCTVQEELPDERRYLQKLTDLEKEYSKRS